MKVLIVGGVAGGASAAARLRRLNEKAQIIMFERGKFISYANCGLPYYVGGEIEDSESLTLQTPKSFSARYNVDVRVNSNVVSVDTKNKNVTVFDLKSNKSYIETYDKLILSPGAEAIKPDLGLKKNDGVFVLKTVPDAVEMRKFLVDKKSAVVVGAGYIGIETAENLVRAGLDVIVIEKGNQVIPPLDYDVSCDVINYIRKIGLDIRLGISVENAKHTEKGIELQLSDSTILNTDILVFAIGVSPDTKFLQGSGIELGNRGEILTDEHMQTNIKDVYAVGDAVNVKDFNTGNLALIPLAGPANRQGRIAADNISGTLSKYKGTQGSSIIKVFDMTVAGTGLNEKNAQQNNIPYDKIYLTAVSHATYYPGAENMSIKVLFEPKIGTILGAQITGYGGVDKRADVLASAIRHKMTAYDLTELELCYAPPYSSAKDPVNMVGFIIENILNGKVKNFFIEDIEKLPDDGSVYKIDVRESYEFKRGSIKGFVNIPLSGLRKEIDKLDKAKPVYVHCQSGMRSYLAARIFAEHGFTTYNLSGGYRLYDAVCRNKCTDKDKNCMGLKHK